MITLQIEKKIKEVIKDIYDIDVDVINSKYEDFDYQSNIGFKIFNILNSSPKKIIEYILDKLNNRTEDFIYKMTENGFLSIKSSNNMIINELESLYKNLLIYS